VLCGCGGYAAIHCKELPRAERYIEALAPFVKDPRNMMRGQLLLLKACTAKAKGDAKAAWGFIHGALELPALQGGSPFSVAVCSYAAAELLHQQGNDREATQHLHRLTRTADEMGSHQLRYMSGLLRSDFAFDRGDDETGLAALRETFSLAKQKALSFIPAWPPTGMARLCAKALEADIEVDYVRYLIDFYGVVPESPLDAPPEWPRAATVRTLDRFEILVKGEPLPSARKSQQRPLALLKALIAFGGRGVPSADLIDALWPDAEGDAGEDAFAKALRRLRRLLGDDSLVQLKAGELSLDLNQSWTDAGAFERLLHAAEVARRAGRWEEWRRCAERAIALYQGPFLPAERDEIWAAATRERLRGQFVRTVLATAEHHEADGETAEAVSALENAIRCEPTTEVLYHRLIALLVKRSRASEAQVIYEHCRHALALSGQEPSAELTTLLARH
jgi:LuxR family maltose regulon positive regulatory protein